MEKMDKFALTEVQLAYMLGRNNDYKSGNVATHYYNEIYNNLDVEKFEKALNKVIAAHGMLHTVINMDASQMELKEYEPYKVKFHDFSKLAEAEQNKEILKIRNELSHKNYEIGSWPMFGFEIAKISEEKKILFVSMDLIISDASSIMIVFNDLYKYYKNPDLEVQKETKTFKDFVEYMIAVHETENYKQAKDYWQNQILDIPTGPSLITKTEIDEGDNHFNRLSYISKGDVWKKARANILRHGIIQTSYVCECYREVLGYWTGNKVFSINLTTTNRSKLEGMENVVGDFTSLTILPMPKEHSENLWENATNLQRKLIEVYSHVLYDGIDVEREYRKHHNLKEENPFPVVFTSLMGGAKEEFDSDFFAGTNYSVSQTPQVYLDCQVAEEEDTLIVTWDYPRGRFDSDVMKKMFEQFIELIELAANEKSENIYDVLKPSKDDLKKLAAYNNSKIKIIPLTLHQLIDNAVKNYPDSIAVIDENQKYTYSQSYKIMQNYLNYLIEKGVKKGERVAVIGNKCANTVFVMWACAYMGAVFVPVHPEYPEERRDYIIKDSNAKLVIDVLNLELQSQLQSTGSQSSDSKSAILQNAVKNISHVSLDDEAYIIYTSGSTGNPKGVVITNGAVYNTLWDMNRRFEVSTEDRIFNLSEFGFDLSIYDLFGSVLAGAALVINRDVRDIANMYNNFVSHKVTIWNSVPSIYNLFLDYAATKENQSAESAVFTASSLFKKVFLSGDWIPTDTFEKSKKLFPKTQLISLGGATEASIWSNYYKIEEVKNGWKSIPYGYPLANQTMNILDENRRILPVGVPGEIYIGGDGVAKGYTKEELTKAGFFEHETLGRIYKTGDAGVMTKELYMNILGRIDSQVKINGYRIETKEIEIAVQNIDIVDKAFVEIIKNGNVKRIFCFVTTVDNVPLTDDDRSYMKDELKNVLPGYMIPYHFEKLESIPLNGNGKVDRKKLNQLAQNIRLEQKTYKKPETEIQKTLYAAWSDMLSHYEFGIDTEFLDAGGDSLMMIHNLALIKELFNVKVSGREFLENATIEQLSDLIEERVG